jgi:hypothetical protein
MILGPFEDGSHACGICGAKSTDADWPCEHVRARRSMSDVILWAIGILVVIVIAVWLSR